MRTVRYHPDARAEFLHQVGYYIAIGTRLADRYNTAVHAGEQQAAATPEAWPKYKHRTRRVIDRTFKFSLVYLYSENEVYVVTVAPMKRKPGYWRASTSAPSRRWPCRQRWPWRLAGAAPGPWPQRCCCTAR